MLKMSSAAPATLVLVQCVFIFVASAETTTKVYELDMPGSDPIRIFEGESLWPVSEPTHFEHRAFHSLTGNSNDEDDKDENSAALQTFLNNYAKGTKNPLKDDQQTDEHFQSVDLITKATPIEKHKEEKSSHWNTQSYSNNNKDDKKGWVSLEPVPWSISKISKWHPNAAAKPSPQTQRPWDNEYLDFNRPNGQGYNSIKPPQSEGYYEDTISSRPPPNNQQFNLYRPIQDSYNINSNNNARPTAIFNQKVQVRPMVSYSESSHKTPLTVMGHQHGYGHGHYKDNKHDANCKDDREHENNANNFENGIITDGRLPDFPSTGGEYREPLRRRGSSSVDVHPETHPSNGDGEWVLLSTTKGYKRPKNRQRSLDIKPQALGVHKSVHLTVLPPLSNSKVNMTTSHGGLLQVESTFETVEQSQKKFAKRQKLKLKRRNRRPQKNTNKNVVKRKPAKLYQQQQQQKISVPTTVVARRHSGPDSSAVLAAVGAGMIPATMAMLVPMAMSGRRKRDINFVTTDPYSTFEITLPRYI